MFWSTAVEGASACCFHSVFVARIRAAINGTAADNGAAEALRGLLLKAHSCARDSDVVDKRSTLEIASITDSMHPCPAYGNPAMAMFPAAEHRRPVGACACNGSAAPLRASLPWSVFAVRHRTAMRRRRRCIANCVLFYSLVLRRRALRMRGRITRKSLTVGAAWSPARLRQPCAHRLAPGVDSDGRRWRACSANCASAAGHCGLRGVPGAGIHCPAGSNRVLTAQQANTRGAAACQPARQRSGTIRPLHRRRHRPLSSRRPSAWPYAAEDGPELVALNDPDR